jgi:predicted ATPase
MITRIEALNYRVLRYVNQSLSNFQVLIGPNASGKSTFLDVIAFLSDILTRPSLTDAIRLRAPDVRDLTWMRASEWLELAIETDIPERFHAGKRQLRYEIRLGVDDKTNELALLTETLWFVPPSTHHHLTQSRLFPMRFDLPSRLTHDPGKHTPKGWQKIVSKTHTGNDYFKAETTDWNDMFRLGPKRPALANLPEDEDRFPVSIWFKRYLSEGVQKIMLNSEALRRPSPPQSPRKFLPDGSNLPWVIYTLEQNHPDLLTDWISHIKTALPDIQTITTVERPEDRHRYLMIEYQTGLKAPAWLVSDGTLRLLALTIVAYLPEFEGIYLIEEPENGIHPKAVETIYQALCNVTDAQIFLATHSPVILSMTEPKQLLCFDRTESGETDVILGNYHPQLTDWQREVSLDVLFAAGVLG